MNFYKEYNRIEYLYRNNPETKNCYQDMTHMFADLLQQLQNQVTRVVSSQRPEKNESSSVIR